MSAREPGYAPGVPARREAHCVRFCLSAASASATRWLAACARGDEGNEGARAPKHCDPVATNGQRFSARAGCLPCRGCDHIVSGLSVRLSLASGEPLASRTSSCCAPQYMERRCATGVRAGCCQACTASIRGPGIRGELYLASDAHDGTDACLNRVTAPAPQSRSADASHVDRGAGSMGEAGGAGISFFDLSSRPSERSALGPRLRGDDVEGRQPPAPPTPVIPLKSGTHASLHERNVSASRSDARDKLQRRDHPHQKRLLKLAWVPACAGMTVRGGAPLAQ